MRSAFAIRTAGANQNPRAPQLGDPRGRLAILDRQLRFQIGCRRLDQIVGCIQSAISSCRADLQLVASQEVKEKGLPPTVQQLPFCINRRMIAIQQGKTPRILTRQSIHECSVILPNRESTKSFAICVNRFITPTDPASRYARSSGVHQPARFNILSGLKMAAIRTRSDCSISSAPPRHAPSKFLDLVAPPATPPPAGGESRPEISLRLGRFQSRPPLRRRLPQCYPLRSGHVAMKPRSIGKRLMFSNTGIFPGQPVHLRRRRHIVVPESTPRLPVSFGSD